MKLKKLWKKEYQDGQYTLTLTDTNGVLANYDITSSDSSVRVSKSGNTLTLTASEAFQGTVRITAKRNNVPTVGQSAKLIAYGSDSLQDVITGVENADIPQGYLNLETPTGSVALKKTSEDGVVAGITFTVSGNGIHQTVQTNEAGELQIDGLTPGVYTVTEQNYDRYEPQEVQRVTVIGGRTSTVTFSNILKRGDLVVTKTSEDGLVEGMKFHLYGTSLSGLPVDEYAVTDSSGKTYFNQVLIGTGYVLEEVDTPIRYVVPDSQTAAVEWNTVASGEMVDTIITDETGMAQSKALYLGKYEVREITAPHGMVLNPEVHVAELVYAGQEVEITETAASFYNDRQKVSVLLEKVMEKNDMFGIGMNGEITAVSSGLYAADVLPLRMAQ